DCIDKLQAAGLPLPSIETNTPLGEFDMVLFSVQYEMLYSNILLMLDLAHIPFYAKDRGNDDPVLIAGGPCAVNPEPFAPFFDIIDIGEGEEMLPEIVSLYRKHRSSGHYDKMAFLEEAQSIAGVYVPALNRPGERRTVVKRFVKDFEHCYYPTRQIVSNLEIVHDRSMVELYRGCANGCRFCQAGFYYRPLRYRSAAKVAELCNKLTNETGYDEISLGSLSTGDYPYLKPLLTQLKPLAKSRHVSLALPSMRLDTFEEEFSSEAKKTSITFAPEAGTQRLRDVINKNITDEDIDRSLTYAFGAGYNSVKLYFMLGLPTETDEDLMGIVDICKRIRELYRNVTGRKDVTVSVSCAVFIPKPLTPFQWEAQIPMEEMKRRQYLVKDTLRPVKGVTFHYHDDDVSEMEAIFARGDQRLAEVLVRAHELGCRFDGWTEHFRYDLWCQALQDCGVDKRVYLDEQPLDKELCWEFIDCGVTRRYLLAEREKAHQAIATTSCNKGCKGCGCQRQIQCNVKEGEA
ncbi:MAG: TIGR03960 family B12-binding radical SAM protein, partial [Clostridia bacterium]|nr:TIGR03960 family B12-binding radical SAM protein [Clostridia bacterium]